MNSKLVSIILPVKNSERYLSLSIESTLNQTYKDIELIIIYSKSYDQTLNICMNYKRNDSRVKIIYPKKNGIAYSLNIGIQSSLGFYIARMDSDDIMSPDRIEKQVKFIIDNNLDICGTWARRIGNKNNLIKTRVTDSEIKTELLFNCAFVHPSIMAKTSFFKSTRYNEKLSKAEDYDLWVRAAKKKFIMMNYNEPLLYYRIHDEQSSNANKKKEANIVRKIKNDYLKHYCKTLDLDFVVTRKAFNGMPVKLNEMTLLFKTLSTFKKSNLAVVLHNLDKTFLFSKKKSFTYFLKYLMIFVVFRTKFLFNFSNRSHFYEISNPL